jgi:hypothetical protein
MLVFETEKIAPDARRGKDGERDVRCGTASEPDGTRNEADGIIFSVFMEK